MPFIKILLHLSIAGIIAVSAMRAEEFTPDDLPASGERISQEQIEGLKQWKADHLAAAQDRDGASLLVKITERKSYSEITPEAILWLKNNFHHYREVISPVISEGPDHKSFSLAIEIMAKVEPDRMIPLLERMEKNPAAEWGFEQAVDMLSRSTLRGPWTEWALDSKRKRFRRLREIEPEKINSRTSSWLSDHDPTIENLKWIAKFPDSALEAHDSKFTPLPQITFVLDRFCQSDEKCRKLANELYLRRLREIPRRIAQYELATALQTGIIPVPNPVIEEFFGDVARQEGFSSFGAGLLIGLGARGDPQFLPIVKRFLSQRSLGPYALRALGKIYRKAGDTEILELIATNVQFDNPDSLEAGWIALLRIGGNEANKIAKQWLGKYPALAEVQLPWDLLGQDIELALAKVNDLGLSDRLLSREEREAIRRDWGADTNEDNQETYFLHCIDRLKAASYFDIESVHGNGAYVKKIEELAAVSRGVFQPQHVFQSPWDLRSGRKDLKGWTFGFVFQNKIYHGKANGDDWFDLEIMIPLINQALSDTGTDDRYWYVSGYEQNCLYFFGDDSLMKKLAREFGFDFSKNGSAEAAQQWERAVIEKLGLDEE